MPATDPWYGQDQVAAGQEHRQSRLLASDRRRSRRRRQLRLPTDDQIAALAGSWDRALSNAGLAARQGPGGYRARAHAVPIVELLERCFAHHATEPTSSELETFARANGIPFPRRERGRSWSDYVREWKNNRLAQNRPVPAGPPPKRERPDYAQDVGAALPGERRGRKWDDIDELAAWVARYLSKLPRGARAVSYTHLTLPTILLV